MFKERPCNIPRLAIRDGGENEEYQMEQSSVPVKELTNGKTAEIMIDGRSILLANVAGKLYAIGNICTHEGCKLSEGTLKGHLVECACHGSMFDVTTGAVAGGPAEKPEPVYATKIKDGRVSAAV